VTRQRTAQHLEGLSLAERHDAHRLRRPGLHGVECVVAHEWLGRLSSPHQQRTQQHDAERKQDGQVRGIEHFHGVLFATGGRQDERNVFCCRQG
jgi:hypothetical protein